MAKEKTALKKKTNSKKKVNTVTKKTSVKKSTAPLNNKEKLSKKEQPKKIKKSTPAIKEEAILSENSQTSPIKKEPFIPNDPLPPLKKETLNIFQIYFKGWQKLFSIKGRSNRSEFFSFWSLSLPILFLINPVFDIAWLNFICIGFSLIILFALLTLTIRRFHDLDCPAFLSALMFLFVFGLLNALATKSVLYTVLYISFVFIYFILALFPGKNQDNKYGKSPKKPSKIAVFITFLLSIILIRSWTGLSMVLYELVKNQF